MKTTLIMKSISLLVILIFSASLSNASVNIRKHSSDSSYGDRTDSDIKTIIKKTVTYPDFAKENQLSGFVLVSFNLDTNGKINVSGINANSYYFQEYVENKLKNLQIEKPAPYSTKTFYYRFDFKLLN